MSRETEQEFIEILKSRKRKSLIPMHEKNQGLGGKKSRNGEPNEKYIISGFQGKVKVEFKGLINI